MNKAEDIQAVEQAIKELQAQAKEQGYNQTTLARVVHLKTELAVLNDFAVQEAHDE